MFKVLCRKGRKVALVVVVPGAIASMFVSFAAVSYIICVACIMVALVNMFFREEMDENEVTTAVAMYIIAALVFFTFTLALSGVPFSIVVVSVAMTGIVAYFAARFVHNCDPRCPVGLLFIFMLPLGFFIGEALKWMSPRKKVG